MLETRDVWQDGQAGVAWFAGVHERSSGTAIMFTRLPRGAAAWTARGHRLLPGFLRRGASIATSFSFGIAVVGGGVDAQAAIVVLFDVRVPSVVAGFGGGAGTLPRHVVGGKGYRTNPSDGHLFNTPERS